MPVFTRSTMKREWMKASQVGLNPKVSKIKSKSKAIIKPPSSAKFHEKPKTKAKAIRRFPSSCAKFLEDIPVIRQVYKPM